MQIAVIGAAGNVGSRVVAEALRRGHRVTPLSRDDVDATDTNAVADLIAGHDVAVGATRPVPGDEQSALVATRSLLDAHAAAGVRFVMVGGAGSLLVPGAGNRLVADDPRWVPPEIADLARTGNDQLTLCREHGRADWTYVTPSALMEPGLRTGSYRVGQDELLVDSTGRSYVSMEDIAVAVVDEIEQPAHRGQRFTVASNLS
ncbi:NAD(P)-dependent oxidoreductase [Aeromicrobium sp.]|uniref:NAD(P)-dependent oxidoreductase n=1 Tax=Aeromicrobium sp. TaxID=1871063 RepID=UPI0019CF1809|nr:NAD(P)H-binding protein [Aeromicrobium sp.]MBC7632385.1 NAD(P)H-binding protein [Aeromicrobium sp.]